MSTDKARVCVLVSSCPSTESRHWNPAKVQELPEACKRSLLVRIVPEKGRASAVFRLEDEHTAALDGAGNPYACYGDVVQAFLGVSKYDVSITVLRNISGNLWQWWNGRRTDHDILKRSKYEGAAREYHCGAFNVYQDGEEIDTVFYSKTCNVTPEEVRASLVNHDGYAPSIQVYEEGKGCPVCDGSEPCDVCGFVG
jgi:hypothetical protein